MGVITQTGKNFALDALFRNTLGAAPVTYVGLYSQSADRPVTGTNSTDLINETTTPRANGDIVVFTAKVGGSGVTLLKPYWVVNKATNSFQLSEVSGGSVVDLGSDLTATTNYQVLTEISGGSPAYARKAIAYSAASGGLIDDSTNGAVFDIPSGATVASVGFFSAVTAGTLQAWDDLTPESFAAQGTYTLTDAKHDLNV